MYIAKCRLSGLMNFSLTGCIGGEMAKEEKTEDEEKSKEGEETEKASAKTPKKKIMKLIIIGAGVVVILGGGFAGWKLFLHKGGDAGTAAATAEHAKKRPEGHIVTLDPFVVNLSEPSEVTYLKITINLEVESEGISAEIQTRTPQIRDAILMLLTSKTAEDVKDTRGKLKLQDDMLERINHFLESGKVKAVYFTEFVMQ